VPTTCPSPDEISISVHVSLPSVDPNPIGDELECTYYNAANASTGLVILFSPTKGVSEADWAAQLVAADPSAVSVPGVGDGAYYSTPPKTTGAMNFYSGAVVGYIYASGFPATQADLSALLADQILFPD
jgi:hypothetical protein